MQAGAMGEHNFTSVRVNDGQNRHTVSVNGTHLHVQLPPYTQIDLELGMHRFVNPSSYKHPWSKQVVVEGDYSKIYNHLGIGKARLETSLAKEHETYAQRSTTTFLLREEVYSIPTLTVEVSEETIFPTTEGKERHRCGDTDVNTDIADLCLISEFSGRRTTTRKEACHIAVTSTIDERNCIVNRLNMNEPQNGSKDLSAGNITLWVKAVENRWTNKIAAFTTGMLGYLPSTRSCAPSSAPA